MQLKTTLMAAFAGLALSLVSTAHQPTLAEASAREAPNVSAAPVFDPSIIQLPYLITTPPIIQPSNPARTPPIIWCKKKGCYLPDPQIPEQPNMPVGPG